MTIQHIGRIVSLIGSFCGLFLLYIVPISVHLTSEYLKLNYPTLLIALEEEKVSSMETIKGVKWKAYER